MVLLNKFTIAIYLFILTASINCTRVSSLAIENINASKTSPYLKKYLAGCYSRGKDVFILTSHSLEKLHSRVMHESKYIKLIDVNAPSHSIKIECEAGYLFKTILHWEEIVFADKFVSAHEESIVKGYNRSFHGVNYIDRTYPFANGKNILVGIKERSPDKTDIDLQKRVKASPLASPEITRHATEISTLVGGAGNSDYNGRGIANGCYFFPSSFDNLFADELALLEENKVTIQNHSYGTIIQNFYGAEAVSYDVQTWTNKNIVHVFSAGNSGESSASSGKYIIEGYANTTANFKAAKNTILVGAIDMSGNISKASSSGPLYDGRLAPHLVALGPNGTSDAAALVSGTVAVMQQSFADKHNGLIPPAPLIKAILFNTADDIHRPGIDYKSGFGVLNSKKAVESIINNEYHEGNCTLNQPWEKEINITHTTKELKITLSWNDSAAAVNNQKALINDLDLEIEEMNSQKIYLPWSLNTFPQKDSLEQSPERKRDSLNTFEQVSIVNPSGRYKLKVKGHSLPAANLSFYIAIKADSINTFLFTSPVHSSDISHKEDSLDIKWYTTMHADEIGALYYSTDRGITWNPIENKVNIFKGQYRWKTRDTSSTLMFRMTTSFGDFFSNEIIIEKPIAFRLEYNCTDSVKITWSPYLYAIGYKIYVLPDSPYLKHLMTVSDTFIVMKKNNFPYQVIAIEPVLSVNIPPRRSEAFQIQNQRTFCYFNTFYFNNLEGNKADLILELSTLDNIDAVVFEQVSGIGSLMKEIKKLTNLNGRKLSALTDELSSGITYFRCRIILKNGGISYTDIISTITSGKNSFLIYPNPIIKGAKLQYVLRQGLNPDINFELFDLTGKIILELKSISNPLDLNGLGPGLFIYRVSSIDKTQIATGKIQIL